MGEIEGTYKVLQTPGSRLGGQKNVGISTLEVGQNLFVPLPPAPAKMQARDLRVKVKLLDDTVEMLDLETKCYGHVLLTEAYKLLNLIETDYFGVEFQDSQMQWTWLDPMKSIDKQIQRPKNPLLRLAVKFFPPDPGQLQEEYTRYLFALQIKRDLIEERLTCSDNTAALLISHLLQSEIGDYDETVDREHLKGNRYLPQQERVQEKMLEFHREHLGQTPAESDFQVLEIARKLEMYGIRFHQASDREGTKINLAVSHMGILVFQGSTKINTFNWSKIRKLSFKRRRFLIKLHPEAHGPYQDTLEFLLGTRDQCKNFWKISVEYHAFFRLLDQPKPKAKPMFFSRGSSFRYSGRTQKQLVDYVRDSGMRKAPYKRRHSKARVSTHTLNADVPKQRLSFIEGLRVPESPSSTVSFQSVHTSSMTAASLSVFTGSSPSSMDPQKPVARSQTRDSSTPAPTTAAAEEAGQKRTEQPGSTSLQSFQGVGSYSVTGNCSSMSSHSGEDSHGVELVIERGSRENRVKCKNDNDEDDFTTGICVAGKEHNEEQQHVRAAAPVFTLTNSQLQLMEEFFDDDPAEISFFAGGSEAFSYKYGDIDVTGSSLSRHLQDSFLLPNCSVVQQRLRPLFSGPSQYYPEPMGVNVDDFRFDDGNDFNGNAQPSDTSELFEVKAHASRMQCLLSPSETSSLINNRSESSSLNNLPLNGVAALNLSASANHSGASSMVNFPACSVHSESSSAFQFSDIIDQMEQLSYPPTMTEDSSSTDTDSWDSETGTPLDVNLFFTNPFVQVSGENYSFDFQNNLRNLTQDDKNEKVSMNL